MKDPKDLDLTKRIRKLSYEIYQLSMTFPKFELYEIGSQLRRATDSILLQFSEGNASIYPKTTIKFLDGAICSGHEVRAILDIILDRKYINSDKYMELENEFKEIQFILIALKNRQNKKTKEVS